MWFKDQLLKKRKNLVELKMSNFDSQNTYEKEETCATPSSKLTTELTKILKEIHPAINNPAGVSQK